MKHLRQEQTVKNNMKKSELKEIIKEQIREILSEGLSKKQTKDVGDAIAFYGGGKVAKDEEEEFIERYDEETLKLYREYAPKLEKWEKDTRKKVQQIKKEPMWDLFVQASKAGQEYAGSWKATTPNIDDI
jgi:hypothetical protein